MNGTRFYLLLILLIGVTVMVACGGVSGPENVYIANEDDNGQTITLAVGDTLQISLPENRSTGYLWSMAANDEAILSLTAEPVYEIEGEPMPGAGGRVTFTFAAAVPGEVALQLINSRSFETDVPPVETFELAVQVTD